MMTHEGGDAQSVGGRQPYEFDADVLRVEMTNPGEDVEAIPRRITCPRDSKILANLPHRRRMEAKAGFADI